MGQGQRSGRRVRRTLTLQDAVLLLQVGDHVILMSIHPTDEEQEEELEREREVHAGKLRRVSLWLRGLWL